jgi:hypothetical protein
MLYVSEITQNERNNSMQQITDKQEWQKNAKDIFQSQNTKDIFYSSKLFHLQTAMTTKE